MQAKTCNLLTSFPKMFKIPIAPAKLFYVNRRRPTNDNFVLRLAQSWARLKQPCRAKIHRDFKFTQFIRGVAKFLRCADILRADLRFGLGPAKIGHRKRVLMVKHILTPKIPPANRRARLNRKAKKLKKAKKAE